MSSPSRHVVVFLAAAACACGGGNPPNGPTARQLQVGGSYQIAPTLTDNGCAGVPQVLPGPAQVAHTAGAADFRLTHFSLTHAGRVQPDGAFATDPLVATFQAGSTDTVRTEGRFTANGFEATVTVDAAHAGAAACRYVVRWQATKQGSANVFP